MQKIKLTCIIILILLSANNSMGQKIDYLDIRDSILTMTCGDLDSGTLHNALHNLNLVDTVALSNIYQYYQDLGMRYWLMSGSDSDSEFFELAMNAYASALHHDPKSSTALYNLAFMSFINLECERGRYYLGLYKKLTPKRKQVPELNKLSLSKCSSE